MYTAGCVRGCTLTIVAWRRIVETIAMRIAGSRGIPPNPAFRPAARLPSQNTKNCIDVATRAHGDDCHVQVRPRHRVFFINRKFQNPGRIRTPRYYPGSGCCGKAVATTNKTRQHPVRGILT